MIMRLRDLMEVCLYKMELHSSKDGSLVASSKESLEKYGDVEVMSVIPKMKVDKKGLRAETYLYVFGSSIDIRRVRGEEMPF